MESSDGPSGLSSALIAASRSAALPAPLGGFLRRPVSDLADGIAAETELAAALHGGIAVVEVGTNEFSFFSSSKEMLAKQDLLWGDRYEGWDSLGREFSLERRGPTPRWWHTLLPADRTYLVIASVDDIEAERALERIGEYLAGAGSKTPELKTSADLPALIAQGLERGALLCAAPLPARAAS